MKTISESDYYHSRETDCGEAKVFCRNYDFMVVSKENEWFVHGLCVFKVSLKKSYNYMDVRLK